jgi:Uncharacterized alpha/beta hydrolase domain (DUF2235)
MPSYSCSSTNCGTAVMTKTDKDKKTIIKMKFIFLFDGTCNNMNNVEARLKNNTVYNSFFKKKSESQIKKIKRDDISSFENGLSNIAHLSKVFSSNQSDVQVTKIIYIEGIGTENNTTDSTMGLALGTGDTGIVGKVDKALSQLVAEINLTKTQKLDLQINAFGFSRGAAAARHFVFRAMIKPDSKIEQKIKQKGIEIEKIEFNFLGIFDTVPHYGLKMSDDIKELDLNTISSAKTIFHIKAQDEYRSNFPFASASSGTEIALPGAHSDIGGSYLDTMDEVDLLILSLGLINSIGWNATQKIEQRFSREKKWLIDEGWFTEDQIKKTEHGYQLNRYGIVNTYANIPLMIMINNAKKTNLEFINTIVDNGYLIKIISDTNLDAFYKHVGNLGTTSTWSTIDKVILRRLRNKYFHFSSYYHHKKEDGLIAQALDTNAPNWKPDEMTGIRERVIYST